MKKLNLALMAGLLILAGCSNDEFNKYKGNEGVKTITSLTATLNEKADTRLHIIDGWEGGDKLLGWQYGDEIEVYSDLNSETSVYYITNIAEGETVATFAGDEVTGNTFYAFFPEGSTRTAYEMINVDEDNPLLLRVNYDNSYTAHPFTDEDFFTYAPMVAISDGDGFAFKQTTGMVHFCVTGIDNIGRVIFKGNNGEPLLGNGYIDLSQDEPQLVIEQGETDMEVWGVTADQDDIHVYFCIPPTTFTKGITLEVWPEDDEYADNHIIKTLSEPMTIGRAEVKTFPTIDVNAELEAAETETRANLKAFYDALDGDNWTRNDNWNTDAPLDEWYGLSVDGLRVTSINLQDNNLQGQFPDVIKEFKELEYLYLDNNNIEGDVPDWFFEMGIYSTNLCNNKLNGHVTAEMQETDAWKNGYHYFTPQQDGYAIFVDGEEVGIDHVVFKVNDEVVNGIVQLHVGESVKLTYTIYPINASHQDEAYLESDNSNILSVTKDGIVSALGTGYWYHIYLMDYDDYTSGSVSFECLRPLSEGNAEDFTIEGRGW